MLPLATGLPKVGNPSDLVANQVDLNCLLEMPIIYGGAQP